jgi:hypothetical protein
MTEAAVPLREVMEWELVSSVTYENPFVDVLLDAEFVAPSGVVLGLPGFHDGDDRWRVRFSPGEAGTWRYRFRATPADPGLVGEGTFSVAPNPVRGFLRTTPGEAWGFRYESGEPAFLLGDTVYNLIAETAVGNDIRPFLARRAEQGFTLLRILLAVVPHCPPNAWATWSDQKVWAWGGDAERPQFDRFDLSYFRAVDETIRLVAEAGLGLEMIMQFPGEVAPFPRAEFTAAFEELWIRYLVARYDAYSCVYFWDLCNEYEYIHNAAEHTPEADEWALRTARLVKRLAPHGHPVAIHNRWELPPFARRFAADPEAIDMILFQVWGTTGRDDAWLAARIEDSIPEALEGWHGSAMNAEYGYETDPDLREIIPIHQWLDADHTRRGAWRSAFCGLGVTGGFHQTWWGFGDFSKDQPGLPALVNLRRFLTEVVWFADLQPAPDVLVSGPMEAGHTALVLADEDRRSTAVYLPVGGEVSIAVSDGQYRWYDPRTGELTEPQPWQGSAKSPASNGTRPDDWALIITRA